MNMELRNVAQTVIHQAIQSVLPDEAVKKALAGKTFPGRVILISVGKAGWQMAKTAQEVLGERISEGIVITKYGHALHPIPGLTCREAGHPFPDENTYRATREAREMVRGLQSSDTVLFLLSGGGSSLFEESRLPLEELQDITSQLLCCGADIVEINILRKRLSLVKGGRFAMECCPAKVLTVILSDVIGDPVDMIASGPTSPDSSTCEQAMEVVKKYDLKLSDEARAMLNIETPKKLDHVEYSIDGSVTELCQAAARICEENGFSAKILTDRMQCEASEAGRWMSSLARKHADTKIPLAFVAGGETVVKVHGTGKGGRNQELALAAAEELSGLDNVLLFSFGSDGTDGPTDAAGGMVDGDTKQKLEAAGYSIEAFLADNDSYHALEYTDGLIFTGPTGTNVNDVAVLLIAPKRKERRYNEKQPYRDVERRKNRQRV